MSRKTRLGLLFLLLLSLITCLASAQRPGQPPAGTTSIPVTSAAHAEPSFDVNAAVEAYFAKMPPARRASSNAYFEGGYWLLLWDFLSPVVVMWLLLHFRWSAWMRDLAERITRFKPLQTALYWVQFTVVVSMLTFPLTVYEGYFREHKYGLLNQTFGPWMRDQVVGLAVGWCWERFWWCFCLAWSDGWARAGGCGARGVAGIYCVCEPDCAGLYSRCLISTRSWRTRESRIRSSAWRGPTEFPPRTCTSSTHPGNRIG